MVVACQMLDDSVKIIEAAHMGCARQRLAALPCSAHAPFADGCRMVARALQQGSQRMGIFNGKIKSVVAHHPGMSLGHPEKQGGSRRGTYGSRAVMAPELHPFRRHRIQRGSFKAVAAGDLAPVFVLLRPVDI